LHVQKKTCGGKGSPTQTVDPNGQEKGELPPRQLKKQIKTMG